MPELPEVEVTRRGISPHIEGQIVDAVVLRRSGLRWPFPENLAQLLEGQRIISTARRGKYLLLKFAHGTVLIHLGMSGHLRVLPLHIQAGKHDHIDLVFATKILRMNDPRRFGAVLWHPQQSGEQTGDQTTEQTAQAAQHALLQNLGVEPLEAEFNGQLLYRLSRQRSTAIKQFLLAGDVVVGVGNIYASESLFRARINPKTAANRIGLQRYNLLAEAIRVTLKAAIEQGGSSLKDFVAVNGQSGYFQQSYFVYDRAGQPCKICHGSIRQIKQGQRSSFYCVNCQK